LLALANQDRLPEPKEIVMRAHAGLTRQLISLDSFATLCYARLDLARHRVALVDCGHNMTMHFQSRTGACVMLRGDNLPLGFSERELYEQSTVTSEPGDVLLFYSDGLIDARNHAGEPFGTERLATCVQTHHQLDPEALIDRIRSDVIDFSRSSTFADDLSCVAIKFAEREVAALPIVHAETEITSDLTDLAQARAFVRRFCENRLDPPLDKESINQLELAVNEATSNIMKHAYGGRTDQQIQLEAEAFADRIVVQLHHHGVGFDPETVKPLVFNGWRESGFGLYLIAHTVDEVRYARDEDGRHLVYLVKYYRPTDRRTP
jgi:anti-sigma regulatory factor (Ser/Thr protein kinase)